MNPLTAVCLAALAYLASAAPQAGKCSRKSTASTSPALQISTICHTAMASTPCELVSTAYMTSTYSCKSTSTMIITTTTTPYLTTFTKTSTTTSTAPAYELTSTSLIITTETSTATTFSTVTATSFSTTTVISTTTISAPTGFLPFQTSLPGVTYDGTGGSAPVKRDMSWRGLIENEDDYIYPQSIYCTISQAATVCDKVVSTITSTETASAIVPTVTSIYISTQAPLATTTITSTVSETLTEVSTSTTTSTSTSIITTIASTTSIYPACATNNFGTDYMGSQITRIGISNESGNTNPGGGTQLVNTTASAYECCVESFNLPYSSVWYFGINPQPGIATYCAIIAENTDSCASPPTSWYIGSELASIEFTIGNSRCGQFNEFRSAS